MNLWFRFFRVVVGAWRKRRIEILGESHLSFRTWPLDLDVNFHMNNGRFLTLMDLGRMDLMLRTGLGKEVVRHKWMPVVASVHMTYRRSLALFQKCELKTRVIAWDEKWFYLQQEFHSHHRLVAKALVKAAIRGKNSTIPTEKILALLGSGQQSPLVPALTRRMIEVDQEILEKTF